MSEQTRAGVVRSMFKAYLAQDAATATALLAEDFAFTSPQDDHIDKAAYLDRCFPTANRLVSQELMHVVELTGDDVFVMYEYELKTGETHRNTEVITVRNGRVVDVQVFFGGRVG